MVEWKDVPGYEGLYKVSNQGDIATKRRQGSQGCVLHPVLQPHGYITVSLCKDGQVHKFYVHRLVAVTFLGEKPGMEVNHKDENRSNNRLENLEWVTANQNCNYGNHNYRVAVTTRTNHAKSVVQCDLNGNEIRRFGILHDAAKFVHGNSINISRAARGIRNRSTAYGYSWRYE